jgi:hypothetical protein
MSNKYTNYSVENQVKELNISNFLNKIEKELTPIIDYINENEEVIKISGTLWNQFFNLLNTINNLKKGFLDFSGIPKSEDLWKSIYEIEKSNLKSELEKLILENKKLQTKNKDKVKVKEEIKNESSQE